MATIKITDLVSGSVNSTKPDLPFWQGTGILDVLIMTINSNIKVIIKGENCDYIK